FRSLGLIDKAKKSVEAARLFEERLNNPKRLPTEDERVRRMAAVSLGPIRAEISLPSLYKNCFDRLPPSDSVETACHWAIERLTGERAVPPKVITRADRDWFLVPNE